MPPKGWKKNADPSEQPFRETDIVSIDDILFPKSTISKLARSITSDEDNHNNMNLAKDSLLALQRSATVFVSYMLFHAKSVSKATGRKTVTAQDIMMALERAEFAGFLPEVKERLGEFELSAKAKKQKKLETKSSVQEEEGVQKKAKVESSSGGIASHKVVASDTEDDGDNDDEEEEEEEEEEDAGDKVGREGSSDEIEDGSDGEENDATNPISQLAKEEQELRGEDIEEARQSHDDEEEDEDVE
ncbi:DPB4 [Candida theae]|uniref:DNA polymerase epsilon subunit D n=1 Tax=Candida theae TaxID=1198502 RepID=A0AAD5FY68_9ASCO|nr:DPB4 [Candida theae]KAI5957490.1 DPB4 [Candida theae]